MQRRFPFLLPFYALGAVPFGIKETGFSIFLMIFYNQVLGLPAWLVGIAGFLALVVDAAVDPLIGHLAERPARRVPLMLAAILPTCLGFWALFSVLELGHAALFAYLLVLSVVVRVGIGVFEVPSGALLARFAPEYAARTRWTAWRMVAGWAGAIGMAVVTYQVFLVDAEGEGSGLLNKAGYQTFASVAACAMGLAMSVSTLGIARAAAAQTSPAPVIPLRRALSLIWGLVAFRKVLFAMLWVSVSIGMVSVLQTYLAVFLYGLSSGQLAQVTGTMLPAVVAALGAAYWVAARFEKRAVARVAIWGFLLATAGPMIGARLGLLPAAGSGSLTLLLCATTLVATASHVLAIIMLLSMGYDLIDELEAASNARREATIVAIFILMRKLVTGVGILAGGVLLSAGGGEAAVLGPAFVPALCLSLFTFLGLGLRQL